MTFLGSFTDILTTSTLRGYSLAPPKLLRNRRFFLFRFFFLFFFLFVFVCFFPPSIHSYTYVVPISALPKYRGGLRLRGKNGKKGKKKRLWKVLKVLLGWRGATRAPPGAWLSSRGSRRRVAVGNVSGRVHKVGADGPLRGSDRFLLLCSLVYKNMGGVLQPVSTRCAR